MTQYSVYHKKSNQTSDGKPKLPTPKQLEYGEIAINYSTDMETISIKNANNAIVTFSADNIIDKKLEKKQDVLESGTNIKTINGESLIGSGNIEIEGGGQGIADAPNDGKKYVRQSQNWVEETDISNLATKDEVAQKQDKGDYATNSAIADMLTKTEANETYAKKSEIPEEYTLPIASDSQLGGVKIGSGLSIEQESGVVNANITWGDIKSKPEEFTPSTHQHNSADITDLQGKLDTKADKTAISDMLTKTEASSTYQPKGAYLTSVPVATTRNTGGIKIGYSTSGKNYKVQLDGESNAFVNVPWTDNNSVTHLYAGSGTTANAATTNGNTKLTIVDDSTVRGSITIKGSGATTVTSDANGAITINSTNTTYSLVGASGTTGLIKNGSSVTSNSGYTACPIISGVPYYKDTNTTYTLSSFGITATAAELNYCDGVTSNIQTQLNGKAASGQTMYLGTTAVPINRASASGLTLNGVNISGSAGSVAWNNVSGKPTIPEQYVLPQATNTTLGGVKVDVDDSGTNNTGIYTDVNH